MEGPDGSDDDVTLAARRVNKRRRLVVEDAEEQPAQAVPSPQRRSSLNSAGQPTCVPPLTGADGGAQPSEAAQQPCGRETHACSSAEADAAGQPECDMQQQQQAADDGSARGEGSGDLSQTDDSYSDTSGGESDSEQGDQRANDPLCAWCDDGGDLLLCDGSCMRSFHVCNEQEGGGCNCMRMPDDLFQRVQGSIDAFLCPCCLALQQQCFSCKKHGNADSSQPDQQQVFRCAVASCGKYYHPACVKESKADMQPGCGYICPLHTCARSGCELPPGRLGSLTEMVPCRRCPVAYHQTCIPSTLGGPDSMLRRVWLAPRDDNGELLPDREVDTSIIYCKKHNIAAGEVAPQHLRSKQIYNLFTSQQLASWRLHYARNYPSLASSAAIIQDDKLQKALEDSDDDDLPLGVRVRGVLKRRLSDAGNKQAAPAAPPTSPLFKAAQLSKADMPVAVVASPLRQPPVSSEHNSAAPSAAAQSTADAQAASSPSRPKFRLPAYQKVAPPPPPAAPPAAPADPSSPAAATHAPDPAIPLMSHSPSHEAAAQQLKAPASVVPAAGPPSEQTVRVLEDAQSQQAGSPWLSEPATAAATQPRSAAAALPPGSPRVAAPAASSVPEPTDHGVPTPTVRRQRSPISRRPRLQPVPTAPDATAVETVEPPGMAAVANESAAAEAPVGATAAAAAAAAVDASEPPVMAAAVQEPAAAEAAISATAAAPDAEVQPPAPSLVTTEEAGLQDVLEEVVGEQGTNAVPAPAVAEQAALMQWEEDADADDQQEVAAEQVTRMVQQLLADAAAQISFDQVQASIRQIEGYDVIQKKTIDPGALQVMQNAVDAAEKRPEHAGLLLSKDARAQLAGSEDDFRIFLAPFLHKDRYSAFGRHFSQPPLLQAVAEILEHFMRPNDVVVDYSCGANEWVPMVKRWCSRAGIKVFGQAYDIFTARNLEDFEPKNWFDTRRGELPPGDRLVIGLNPPFGKNGQLANQFVNHAATEFAPRVMVLIAPPITVTPAGYKIVFENNKLTADRVFYVPGVGVSWNKVAPPLRIMVRDEIVNSAWHDPGAHALLDQCVCPPAHASQNPQEPAFIGEPHEAAHPLQRGSSFGFGGTFGAPTAPGPGVGIAPAPVFQPVQDGMAAGGGGGTMHNSMNGGGAFQHQHNMPLPDSHAYEQHHHQQQHHMGEPPRDPRRHADPQHAGQPTQPSHAVPAGGQLADWQPPPLGAPGGPLGPMRRVGSTHQGSRQQQPGADLRSASLPASSAELPCFLPHGGVHAEPGGPDQGAAVPLQGPPHADAGWHDRRLDAGVHAPGSRPHGPGLQFCGRCGGQGHMDTACRQPPRNNVFFCSRCGGSGHLARNCTRRADMRQHPPAATRAQQRKRPRSPPPRRSGDADPPAAKRRDSRSGRSGSSGSSHKRHGGSSNSKAGGSSRSKSSSGGGDASRRRDRSGSQTRHGSHQS